MTMLKMILFFLFILLSVAFSTLLERKVLALAMFRKSPNKTFVMGVTQPISDAVKLSTKQQSTISNFQVMYGYISVVIMLGASLIAWSILTENSVTATKLGVIIFLLVISLNSIFLICLSWASSNKYSTIGMVRCVSQMISYEPPLFICVMILVIIYCSSNIMEIFSQDKKTLLFFYPLIIMSWIPCMKAELGRNPVDLSEGESELVSGVTTEVGSAQFTMVFLAEYSNILMFSLMTSCLFMPNSSVYITMSVTIFLVLMIFFCRACFPRMRYDKFMHFSWKLLIPQISLLFIFYFISV